MTEHELKGLGASEIRKLARDAGLKGLPGALVDKETATAFVSGQMDLDTVLQTIAKKNADNIALLEWFTSKRPDLINKTIQKIKEEKNSMKESVEVITNPSTEKVGTTSTEEMDNLDPRRHENWKLLVDVSKSMGVPLEKALEKYADEYRSRIGDLEAELATLKRSNIPEHKTDDWGVSPYYEPSGDIHDALWYIEKGDPVLLVGPAGSGKSMGIRWICKHLKRKMILISMHGHIMADTLEGYSWLQVKDGVTYQDWARGVLQIALEEGAILVCDEIDRAPTAIQHMLNDVAQSKSLTFKEGPFAGQTIKAKPGFLVVGTGNTINGSTGEFTSTAIDKSTLSRFRVLRVTYDTKAEKKLLVAIGLNPETTDKVMRAFNEARREAKNGRLFTAPGTRHLEKLAKDIARGMAPAKAWKYNISNMQTEDSDNPIYKLAETIGQMIA